MLHNSQLIFQQFIDIYFWSIPVLKNHIKMRCNFCYVLHAREVYCVVFSMFDLYIWLIGEGWLAREEACCDAMGQWGHKSYAQEFRIIKIKILSKRLDIRYYIITIGKEIIGSSF